jgi:hypothetical protein
VYTWCIILLINIFSKTFPPTFIKHIGPNFDGSVVSLPGFVSGTTFTLLHLLGKHVCMYICMYIYIYICMYVCVYVCIMY